LERLQEESYAQIERFRASHRLTRQELHLQEQQNFGGIYAISPFK